MAKYVRLTTIAFESVEPGPGFRERNLKRLASRLDEAGQAKNILASGLQIPGFRKDPRVLESILKRYVMPLTIMGGLAIGLLASVANLLGALTGGTSILLAVMIMYKLYEDIAKQHMEDMYPALRGMIG